MQVAKSFEWSTEKNLQLQKERGITFEEILFHIERGEEMLASYRRLRALEAAGARLYFGHDPAPWAHDPQAALEIS